MIFQWRKLASERILVGLDWTAALDGATIAGTVDVAADGPTLTATFDRQEGAVTYLWIEGGTAGNRGQEVRLTAETSEGERLVEIVPVWVAG